jgi:hypothetical protein
MIALAEGDAARLGAFLALAEGDANPHDGERLAALAAAERLLAKHGLRLRDLPTSIAVAAPPSPLAGDPDLLTCLAALDRLTAWERNFIVSLRGFRTYSAKQAEALARIAARLRAEGAP